MQENKQDYISRVHLKGFKSIQDLEIDFKPGLNIIIGPNGSGKTNFMDVLYMTRRMSNIDSTIESRIHIVRKNDTEVIYELNSEKSDIEGVKFIYSKKQTENGKVLLSAKWRVFEDNNRIGLPFEHSESEDYWKESSMMIEEPILIQYGLPEAFSKSMVEPQKVSLNVWKTKLNTLNAQENNNIPFFLERIFRKSQHSYYNTDPNDFKIESIKFDELNDCLSRFSPIQKIRFDEKRVFQYIDEKSQTFVVENLMFNFFVAGKWLYWSQLSDGTKRLFYIISSIFYYEKFVLIEEPEIGIHPDQLYKLMDFLKEQSEKKQIILTTHSPEVLNVLGKDELDHIIVTRYDEEEGTKMHHLSAAQIRKAHIFMDETGGLSDFWVHSNLEEYDKSQKN